MYICSIISHLHVATYYVLQKPGILASSVSKTTCVRSYIIDGEIRMYKTVDHSIK